jgi:DNA-binding MarR family transcriptional regulator
VAEPAPESPGQSPQAAASGPATGLRLGQVAGGRAADDARALDRLVHGKIRLGILSALAVNRSLTFTQLRDLLQTSDGNVSVHARKLEEGGYVSCSKTFEGRQPKTEYALTDEGREALRRYLDHMESLINTVRDR